MSNVLLKNPDEEQNQVLRRSGCREARSRASEENCVLQLPKKPHPLAAILFVDLVHKIEKMKRNEVIVLL